MQGSNKTKTDKKAEQQTAEFALVAQQEWTEYRQESQMLPKKWYLGSKNGTLGSKNCTFGSKNGYFGSKKAILTKETVYYKFF